MSQLNHHLGTIYIPIIRGQERKPNYFHILIGCLGQKLLQGKKITFQQGSLFIISWEKRDSIILTRFQVQN